MKLPATDRAMTPGPWFWLGNCLMANRSDHSELVADVAMPILSEADKALIAAAPDIYRELKQLRRAYVNLLEIGRDRIISLGGDCDPVDVMEASDPVLRSVDAALSLAGDKP